MTLVKLETATGDSIYVNPADVMMIGPARDQETGRAVLGTCAVVMRSGAAVPCKCSPGEAAAIIGGATVHTFEEKSLIERSA